MNASRRRFMQSASSLSMLGPAAPFALNLATMNAASAQTANDYRALVCLFMYGGNDQGNMVLATDPDSWNAYLDLRATGSQGIALPGLGADGGVIDIAPSSAQAGRSFALHPSLSDIKSLFDSGEAAVVSNVGPLIAPTSKADYQNKSVPLPKNLFSHNDQQSTWQAYAPEGATVGWGGRMGDLMASMNSTQTFTCMSTGGNTVFLAGQDTVQYRVGSNGAASIGGLNGYLFGSNSAPAIFQDIITRSSSHVFEQSHANVTTRAITSQSALNSALLEDDALEAVPRAPDGSSNRVAQQLNTVARIIGGRSALGARRQVFFVSMGGFDTHGEQNRRHGDLMAQLGQAIAYFQRLLADPTVDAKNETTLFTASDFGRTLASNGDGTDHGWGSHHFVVGGAVNGGNIYGQFPIVGKDTSTDVGRGRLLPGLSVDQYGATLARWFGVPESQMSDVFPNLANFSSNQDLGFMRA